MTCRARAACLLAALLALGGCSQPSWSSINPIQWWHGLEGGAIAQQRPPPPGANQPYPNLASVPPKPAEPDRAALQNISDALTADRANAQRMAAAAPLADPSSPSASPDLFGVGTTPPPGPASAPGAAPAASATLPAANAPPAPPSPPAQANASVTPPAQANAPVTPPAKAPVGAVASNPLPEPTPPPAPLSVGPTLPPLPAAPPPPANVTGMPAAPAAPKVTAAPTQAPPVVPAPARTATVTPPAAPAPTPAPPPTATAAPAPTKMASLTPSGEPESSANTVAVIFADGVAEMPPSAATPLRALAGRRGSGLIAIVGYGDAADANPDTQAAALKLGLARAQAIASALVADGVPATAVQIDAQAMGRGGTARLVQ